MRGWQPGEGRGARAVRVCRSAITRRAIITTAGVVMLAGGCIADRVASSHLMGVRVAHRLAVLCGLRVGRWAIRGSTDCELDGCPMARLRSGLGLVVVATFLLQSALVGQAQAGPQVLAGTAWSDGVLAPVADLGVRLPLRTAFGLSFELTYLRSHVRDSVPFCGITGECPVRDVRLNADLVQVQALFHVRVAPGLVPTLVGGGFVGLRSGCSGRSQCDWRRPVQAGPALGLELHPTSGVPSLFLRGLVQRSFSRTAAVTTAESGAEKSYHPLVVHVLVGVAVR